MFLVRVTHGTMYDPEKSGANTFFLNLLPLQAIPSENVLCRQYPGDLRPVIPERTKELKGEVFEIEALLLRQPVEMYMLIHKTR